MKWVVALLLVANVSAYMWHVAHRDASATQSAAQDVDVEGMRLLRDRDEGDGAVQQPVQPPAAPAGGAAPAPRTCLRIGPFAAPLGMESAADRLSALGLDPQTRTVAGRTVRAHRVFLGPFEEPTGLAAARRRLNEAGITDHYVIRNEDGGGMVSLGLFSRRDAAADYVARLAEAGINADIRVETRELGATYWLELLDGESLRGRTGDVRGIDWAEQQVAVRDIDCPVPARGPGQPVPDDDAGVESASLPPGPHSSVGRAADL